MPVTTVVMLVAVVEMVLAGRDVPPPVPVAAACAPAWSTAWQAAVQPVPAPAQLMGGTLRMVVTPQATGSQVRIRLSNTYGTGPLDVGSLTVGTSSAPGTADPAGFGGHRGVVVPPGGEVTSDPVPVPTRVGVPLTVDAAVVAAPGVVSGHADALETSWLIRGTGAGVPTSGTALPSWYLLAGVDVLVPRPVHAVVAVGDSITDGVGTASGSDARWTDALAARLAGTGGQVTMAVLNAGISRNELLADAPGGGAAPLARFDGDVTQAAGATDVVLHVGTNDIAAGAGAEAIEAGMVAFAERTRAAGKHVFLTTITPSTNGAHGTPAASARRFAVNAWVREHGREHADGVIDFAAAVADPADPARLAPAFDAGDGLHLSATGYRALADAVDVRELSGSPCLASSPPGRTLTPHVSGDPPASRLVGAPDPNGFPAVEVGSRPSPCPATCSVTSGRRATRRGRKARWAFADPAARGPPGRREQGRSRSRRRSAAAVRAARGRAGRSRGGGGAPPGCGCGAGRPARRPGAGLGSGAEPVGARVAAAPSVDRAEPWPWGLRSAPRSAGSVAG